jgi:signal transduction histidine kinase
MNASVARPASDLSPANLNCQDVRAQVLATECRRDPPATPDAAAATPAVSFAGDFEDDPVPQSLAVLVVDDDPLIIDMLAHGLPYFGFVTLPALSAAEARKLLAERSDIGVVVSDINMPTETGLALAQELLRDRAEEDALEVILMTGRSNPEDAVVALRSRVTDFIAKPFAIRDLSESVSHALRSAQHRRERMANANNIAAKVAEAESERRRLTAVLNQTTADLEASKRARNDLIAMVSHELRTPLIPIIGFAETMRRSPVTSPADVREWATTIERCGRRLLSMINGALDIVALDQGRGPAKRSAVVLEALLARVVASHRALAVERGVRVVLRVQPGLVINADSRAIEVAVGHLVDNAIRASPVGETVRMVARTADNLASIAVSDRGPGVPPNVMEQLGTPFLQADLSFCRRWDGVGLGLALALRITRSHGGRLSLIPRSDGGTVGLIELPALPDAGHQDGPDDSSEEIAYAAS